MIILHRTFFRNILLVGVAWGFASATNRAEAQWPRSRRPVRYVPTSAPQVPGVARSPMLGTFYPEPYLNVRGNGVTGSGYAPLGIYGEANTVMYGPLSAFRDYAAPVKVYQRGYDGSFRETLGTSFSTPNQPATTNVLYPTRANVRNSPRRVTTPPAWESGIDFIDLN